MYDGVRRKSYRGKVRRGKNGTDGKRVESHNACLEGVYDGKGM